MSSRALVLVPRHWPGDGRPEEVETEKGEIFSYPTGVVLSARGTGVLLLISLCSLYLIDMGRNKSVRKAMVGFNTAPCKKFWQGFGALFTPTPKDFSFHSRSSTSPLKFQYHCQDCVKAGFLHFQYDLILTEALTTMGRHS